MIPTLDIADAGWESVVVWTTLAIAFGGGVIAVVARGMVADPPGALPWAGRLFFGAMAAVALVTLVALAAGHGCWISGGGSLLFMALVGTIDSGRAPESA
ncbi:MAG TPA: hypothetical protein ENJ62_04785 [Bryobacterales bacterium]|nr:hypothetical protein [Bryobacterales bacterium]